LEDRMALHVVKESDCISLTIHSKMWLPHACERRSFMMRGGDVARGQPNAG
jgi:hypothetical protein